MGEGSGSTPTTKHRRDRPSAVRGVRAALVAATSAAVLLLGMPVADAGTLIVVAHRGASGPSMPGNTAMAFRYAAPYADRLEADVRWTRNPTGPVGARMVLMHNATLDQTTNCTGYVKDRTWAYIRDRCRTKIASQPLMTLAALLRFADARNKGVNLHLKTPAITDRQAAQFYNTAKNTPRVELHADIRAMASLRKVKALDRADPRHRLQYGYSAWTRTPPSVATVRSVGNSLHIDKSVSASRIAAYERAGIQVFLGTGFNPRDYALMVAKAPTAVSVSDAKRFQAWYRTRFG